MIGALAAVGFFPRLDDARLRTVAAFAGIALILGSFVLLTVDTPFPGLYALPACLGAVGVIWSGACGPTVVSQALACRPLVAVGLTSYSLYLLHWPLLVFARYWNRGELSTVLTMAVLAAAFVGAWLSWRFVEQPFRKPGTAAAPRRVLFGGAVVLMAALGVTGATGAYWQAGSFDAADKFIEAEKRKALGEHCMVRDTQTFVEWPAARCTIAGRGEAVAVWGDSFAAHYFDAFRQWAAASGRPLTLLAESSCPPIAALSVPNRPGCANFNAGAIAWLKEKKPAIVVLSANWMVYEKKKSLFEMFEDKFELLRKTVEDLRRAGIRVWVIGPSPAFPAPVARIAASSGGKTAAKASYSRKFDRLFRELARDGAIVYMPAFASFCDDAMICRYRDEKTLFFWDAGHMTERAAAIVVGELMKADR
jgi:hypothetical protein